MGLEWGYRDIIGDIAVSIEIVVRPPLLLRNSSGGHYYFLIFVWGVGGSWDGGMGISLEPLL